MQQDANYQEGQICAKGRAGVAAPSATACHAALTATTKTALAMRS